MNMEHWILDENGNPKPVDSMTWALWFKKGDCVVKQEMIGGIKVSTVFLGLNHNWKDGPPLLWETMVFGGKLDQLQERCSGNREQAEAMHNEIANKVKEIDPDDL